MLLDFGALGPGEVDERDAGTPTRRDLRTDSHSKPCTEEGAGADERREGEVMAIPDLAAQLKLTESGS